MEDKSNKPELLRNNCLPNLDNNKNSAPKLPGYNYVHAATSSNTRRAYKSDVRHFIKWGGILPTTTETIIQYLQQHASSLNSRTLVRRITSLKNWHLYQGFSDPTAHPIVRKTLTGIKNIHGKPKDKAMPLTMEILTLFIEHLKNSSRLIDYRNSALLQIGFFGAFRRSELVAVQWEHVHEVSEGIEILIPRSKTDQDGEGEVCAIPFGKDPICPVTALMEWRNKSNCQIGAVFRQVRKNDQLQEKTIKSQHVNTIIKTVARSCKLQDAEEYSSHSLRRGFATEASRKGAPFGAIMRQGRWRHEGTVLGYIDEGKRFDQNAADVILNN